MTRADRESWVLPHGAPIPDDMMFVADPPSEIGAVRVAWTNNGPSGPKAPPLSWRLTTVGLWAMGGFVVGLIGVFAVGAILEQNGGTVSANAFLASIVAGALAGAVLGALSALRRPGINTLFVGEEGCAEISTRGGRSEARVTQFGDVESFRSHVSTWTSQGIRTSVRELHMRPKRGKERLWLVSAPETQAAKDDPQYHYCEAVLRAFEAYRARSAA